MLSPYLKRIIIDVALFIALMLGIYYFKKVFIDYMISLFHFYNKINPSAIAYTVIRIIYLFIPLIMLTAKTIIPKKRVFQAFFYIIGVCYFLGNVWIFYYLKDNSLATLLKASTPVLFAGDELKQSVLEATNVVHKFQYDNALVLNYILWDSYDLFGVAFSFIQGYLYIDLARNFGGRKHLVMKKFVIITAMAFFVPILYSILVRGRLMFSSDWGIRNILVIFESFFIIIAMSIAVNSRTFWSDIFR